MNLITRTARGQTRTSANAEEKADEVDLDAEDGLQD
jgi:hypothetical protein